MKTNLSQQFYSKGLPKILLLGIPMDPIFNFLERADRELSEIGSIGMPSKILVGPLEKLCCDRVVFTSEF